MVAEQELHHHARRELGRAAEAAVLLVVVPRQREQRLSQLLLAGHALAPVCEGPLRKLSYDSPGNRADLRTPVGPGGVDAFEDLPEGRHAVPGAGGKYVPK